MENIKLFRTETVWRFEGCFEETCDWEKHGAEHLVREWGRDVPVAAAHHEFMLLMEQEKRMRRGPEDATHLIQPTGLTRIRRR